MSDREHLCVFGPYKRGTASSVTEPTCGRAAVVSGTPTLESGDSLADAANDRRHKQSSASKVSRRLPRMSARLALPVIRPKPVLQMPHHQGALLPKATFLLILWYTVNAQSAAPRSWANRCYARNSPLLAFCFGKYTVGKTIGLSAAGGLKPRRVPRYCGSPESDATGSQITSAFSQNRLML